VESGDLIAITGFEETGRQQGAAWLASGNLLLRVSPHQHFVAASAG
jgi:hypothetical protein